MKKQTVIISLLLSVVIASNCMENENQNKKNKIQIILDNLVKLDCYCNIRAKNRELLTTAKSKLHDKAWGEVHTNNPMVLQGVDQLMQLKSDIEMLLQPRQRLYKEAQQDGYLRPTLSPNTVIEETETREMFKRVPGLLITSLMLQCPTLENRLNKKIDKLCSHFINRKLIKALHDTESTIQNKEDITKKYQSILANQNKNAWIPKEPCEKEISETINFLTWTTIEKESREIDTLIRIRVEEMIRIRRKKEKNETRIIEINALQDKYEVDAYRQELNKKIQRKYSLEAIQNYLKTKLQNDTATFMITQCACITNQRYLEIMITELQQIILEKMNPVETTI